MPQTTDDRYVFTDAVLFSTLPQPAKNPDADLLAHDKPIMDLIRMHLEQGGPGAVDRAESISLGLHHPDNVADAKKTIAAHHKAADDYLAQSALGQAVLQRRKEATNGQQ